MGGGLLQASDAGRFRPPPETLANFRHLLVRNFAGTEDIQVVLSTCTHPWALFPGLLAKPKSAAQSPERLGTKDDRPIDQRLPADHSVYQHNACVEILRSRLAGSLSSS